MKHKFIEYSTKELQNEIWKPIPNYTDSYEASSLGRIRTKEGKTTYTQKHGIRHWKQRVLKYKCSNDNAYKSGYKVDLWNNGEPKTFLVARLVASTFLKDYLFNDKITVNHIDGNRLNNKIENLEWCTLGENIKKGFEENLYFQKKIKLINKKTNEEKIFRSLSQAGIYAKKNKGYFSCQIKRQKFENGEYKWELIDHQ